MLNTIKRAIAAHKARKERDKAIAAFSARLAAQQAAHGRTRHIEALRREFTHEALRK